MISTYMIHSKASGAEFNHEKTQILDLELGKKTKVKNFKREFQIVNIMRAIFCNDKESETKENLEKTSENS